MTFAILLCMSLAAKQNGECKSLTTPPSQQEKFNFYILSWSLEFLDFPESGRQGFLPKKYVMLQKKRYPTFIIF